MTNFLATLTDNLKTIFSTPIGIITLVGCVLIIISIIKFKSIKLDTKMMTRISIAIALSVILDMFKIYTLPNGGGSVSIGSMLPLFLISLLYGPSIGMLSGFLYGLLKLIIDPFLLNPIQILFDYPLPFMCIGIAGFFRSKLLIGLSVSMFFRFIFHFISGVIFFGEYAPEGVSSIIYSGAVNGFIIGSDLIICLIIISFLPMKKLLSIFDDKKNISKV